MYANHMLLQGMWERTARQYLGLAGTIRRLAGFQMRIFNTAGDTVVVHGQVERKWLEGDAGFVDIKMWSENAKGVSVGPGRIVATLPLRRAATCATS